MSTQLIINGIAFGAMCVKEITVFNNGAPVLPNLSLYDRLVALKAGQLNIITLHNLNFQTIYGMNFNRYDRVHMYLTDPDPLVVLNVFHRDDDGNDLGSDLYELIVYDKVSIFDFRTAFGISMDLFHRCHVSKLFGDKIFDLQNVNTTKVIINRRSEKRFTVDSFGTLVKILDNGRHNNIDDLLRGEDENAPIDMFDHILSDVHIIIKENGQPDCEWEKDPIVIVRVYVVYEQNNRTIQFTYEMFK